MKSLQEAKDLRTSLELLKKMEGQLVETDIEVDPTAELAGVYRHVGAGGTVMRPTKIGTASVWKSFCKARCPSHSHYGKVPC